MQLTFRIRDEAAKIANFRTGYDRALSPVVKRTVRRNAGRMLELVHAYVAFDTGRMLRLVKVVVSPSGLVFECGWSAADFYAEGEPFYPPYVELGTSRMSAQPSLMPAYLETVGKFRSELAGDMRRSANRVR